MISSVLLCLVVGVSDGDSLTARCAQSGRQQQLRVRIHAIDAPEQDQAFSQAARKSLADLCLQVKAKIQPVTCDQYGRTVAQVECRGQDVAAHQVRSGMAWVYERYAENRADLQPLQAQAQATRTGLWADSEPLAPWQWRQSQFHRRATQ